MIKIKHLLVNKINEQGAWWTHDIVRMASIVTDSGLDDRGMTKNSGSMMEVKALYDKTSAVNVQSCGLGASSCRPGENK